MAARQCIRLTLIDEIEAMVIFALGSGIGVSGDVLDRVDQVLPRGPQTEATHQRSPALPDSRRGSEGSQSTRGGLEPPDVSEGRRTLSETRKETAEPGQLAVLAKIHWDLTELVAPAQPGALMLLRQQHQSHPARCSFGAVGIVRKMFLIAFLSLAVLLGVALTPEVSSANLSKGLLALQGYPLLVNEIFLVAAATMGATLANLKRLERYVSGFSFDGRH